MAKRPKLPPNETAEARRKRHAYELREYARKQPRQRSAGRVAWAQGALHIFARQLLETEPADEAEAKRQRDEVIALASKIFAGARASASDEALADIERAVRGEAGIAEELDPGEVIDREELQ